jgi:GDPmannose 4,6-dehydratase
MWMMLQSDTPDDFVIATGRTVSVREFCRIAFDYVGLKAEDYLTVKQEFLRPAEIDRLLGDPSKAKAKLGWRSEVTLEEMIREMVDADLERIHKEL